MALLGDAVDIEVEVTMAERTMRSDGMVVWSGGVVGAVGVPCAISSSMCDSSSGSGESDLGVALGQNRGHRMVGW